MSMCPTKSVSEKLLLESKTHRQQNVREAWTAHRLFLLMCIQNQMYISEVLLEVFLDFKSSIKTYLRVKTFLVVSLCLYRAFLSVVLAHDQTIIAHTCKSGLF